MLKGLRGDESNNSVSALINTGLDPLNPGIGKDPTSPLSTNHPELSYFGGSLECSLPSKCLHGIFNSENLNTNTKRLDMYYQMKISPEELDERHFINREFRGNLTPLKMSPFARFGPFNNQNGRVPLQQIGSESPY